MNKVDWSLLFGIAFVALFIVLAGTGLFFAIYAFVAYGDKPITEIPMWALWFLRG